MDTNGFLKEMNSNTKIFFNYALNLIDWLHNNKDNILFDSEELTPSTEFALGFFLAGIKYHNEFKTLFERYGVNFNKCYSILSNNLTDDYDIVAIDKTLAYNTYDFTLLAKDFVKKLKERLEMEDELIKVSDVEFYQIFYYIYVMGGYKIEKLLQLCNCDFYKEITCELENLVLKYDLQFIDKINKVNYKILSFDDISLYFYDNGKITLKSNDKDVISLTYGNSEFGLKLDRNHEFEILSINDENKFDFISIMNDTIHRKYINLRVKNLVTGEEFKINCDTKSIFKNGMTNIKEENIEETPTPFLEKYGTELTKMSFLKDPSVGRDDELKRVEQVLLYPEKDKSVIIVGEAGCGKTALVRGLAYRIQNGDVPTALKNIRIFSINVSSLVAGTKYVGTLEEKMRNILNEASKDKNIILFIDEIHQTIGGGKSEGNNNTVSEILKPYIDYGDVRIIGATTIDEYDEFIQSDTAFKTRLKKVSISEPDDNVIYSILDELISKYDEISYSKFNLDDYEKSFIINWLIESTQKKYRTYNDRSSNPRLVLDIIKEAYAIAAINDREKISHDDLALALMNENRLYESSKINQCKKLNDYSPKKNVSRIIKFVPKKEN